MVTVSFVELWLPHMVSSADRSMTCICASIGAFAFFLLWKFMPEPDYMVHQTHQLESGEAVQASPDEGLRIIKSPGSSSDAKHTARGKWRLAMMMMIVLTVHNFPEGLAVAVTSLQNQQTGFIVMVAVAVHNIPEGIAIAVPVMEASGSPRQAMLMATLSGLAEPLGALVALFVLPAGALEGRAMVGLVASVGGIMTSVALIELFPEAHSQGRPIHMIAGIVLGVVIMLLTHKLA